ncbi:MAG: sigma 54-interacting transcriptional regulator [Myxococcota bacterium]
MPTVAWRGDAPRGLLQQTLKANGWEVDRLGDVAVVRTGGVEVPDAPRGTPWVWVTSAPVTVAMAQAAADRGALDVVSSTRKGWETRLVARLAEALVPEPELTPPAGFVAQSAAAKELLRKIHLAAQTSMPVLLTGETGTGKELAARLIHQWSARKGRTFVPINCAAIPNELMEGELFGYVKGAFSGAARDYPGQLAAAEGGTVFLDEIDDTPHALQTKLLRVLEDRVISRLGENAWQQVDFRVVAATNRDLRKLIAAGTFGDDLYERLATVQLVLPPLRERLDDLEPLVLQLIERYYAEDPGAAKRHRVREVTPEALEVLKAYPWPGNIRELRNVVFGALVTRRAGSALLVSDLPRRLWARPEHDAGLIAPATIEQRIAAGDFNLKDEIEALERVALSAALRRAQGNAAKAARLLGDVGRGRAKDPGGTVRTMMKRLGLGRP